MHQAVLVHADVDKGTEGGDVGDDAGQLHALFDILDAGDVLVEFEYLELGTGVETGFVQLFQDVLQGGQSAVGGDITVDVNLFAQGFVVHQLLDGGAEVGGHLLHEGITLGVHGTAVEGIVAFAHAEESGALLEGFVAKAFDFLQLLARVEGSFVVAVVDDFPGKGRAYAADIAEEFAAGGVELHAYAVDTADHHIVEAFLQEGLVDIVLVLSHANAFGIDFHQFAEGVHEAASYADGSADGDVVFGELTAGQFGGTVDGGSVFADHNGDDLAFEAAALDNLFGLAPGGAVADGYGLDVEGLDKGFELGNGGAFFTYRGEGVDGLVVEQLPLCIEADGFAAGAEAGVDGQDALLPKG